MTFVVCSTILLLLGAIAIVRGYLSAPCGTGIILCGIALFAFATHMKEQTSVTPAESMLFEPGLFAPAIDPMLKLPIIMTGFQLRTILDSEKYRECRDFRFILAPHKEQTNKFPPVVVIGIKRGQDVGVRFEGNPNIFSSFGDARKHAATLHAGVKA
jgi:hypothetical protein